MRILFAVTALFAASVHAASFEGYTEFSSFTSSGRITALCRTQFGQQYQTFYCRGEYLSPFEFGHFTLDQGVMADTLELRSLRGDGRTVEKTMDFDSRAKRSAKRVNLWINTLLQTALLDYGTNVVSYELSKDGEVQAEGVINVTVTHGPQYYCQPSTDQFPADPECRNANLICERYFRSQNYCR